jgi:DivIVA domain-containing protein
MAMSAQGTVEPTVDDAAAWSRRISPNAVRRWQFQRAPLGRRGYVEAEVDRLLNRLADQMARSDATAADLRAENERLVAEVHRLHDYFRTNRIDPDFPDLPAESTERPHRHRAGPDAQAVNMMSLAQQAADEHIAQAEAYARQLLGDARRQYEEIILTAQANAEEAAEAAAHQYRARTPAAEQTAEEQRLAAQAAYVRTFANVTQIQLRSILEALDHELGTLTGTATGPAARTGGGLGQ